MWYQERIFVLLHAAGAAPSSPLQKGLAYIPKALGQGFYARSDKPVQQAVAADPLHTKR
jgi:hypothetical protein